MAAAFQKPLTQLQKAARALQHLNDIEFEFAHRYATTK